MVAFLGNLLDLLLEGFGNPTDVALVEDDGFISLER